MKYITAVIPARGGSRGIPRKNIVKVGNHPLIAYSIAACKMSKRINRIIVSTDDEEIASIARTHGAEVPFMRPPEYATAASRDVDFLQHFFENIDVDEVALIRPTTPLRDPAVMDAAIDLYFKCDSSITSLRSVALVEQSPYKTFEIRDNICYTLFESYKGIKNYSNLPRQEFPPCYQGNGHLDIVKKNTIQTGDAFGDKIYGFIVDRLVDVDVPFDLEVLRLQINTHNDLITKFLETQ